LHEIRQLTDLLNEFRSHGSHLSSELTPQTIAHSDYEEKLERCCHRLDQLTSKVDRLINFDQTSKYILHL
jgi:hypothetical protein